MDGDDISHDERITKQVRHLMSNPDVVLCGTWYQFLGSDKIVENPTDNDDIKISLLDFCALGHPTVMFRKEFLIANHLTYDPEAFAAEDYELWTRISAIGKMENIPETLLFYRTHENQVSNKEKPKQLKCTIQCMARMLCYPLINPSLEDITISELIVENGKISDILKLANVVNWLDRLFETNNQTGFYNENKFQKYITQKKGRMIRKFFLHTTSYSPAVLCHFYKSGEYRRHFTSVELSKFMLKCILSWK